MYGVLYQLIKRKEQRQAIIGDHLFGIVSNAPSGKVGRYPIFRFRCRACRLSSASTVRLASPSAVSVSATAISTCNIEPPLPAYRQHHHRFINCSFKSHPRHLHHHHHLHHARPPTHHDRRRRHHRRLVCASTTRRTRLTGPSSNRSLQFVNSNQQTLATNHPPTPPTNTTADGSLPQRSAWSSPVER